MAKMKSNTFIQLTACLLAGIFTTGARAQNTRQAPVPAVVIAWQPIQHVRISPGVQKQMMAFPGCGYDPARKDMPFYSEKRPLPANHDRAGATLTNTVFEELDAASTALLGSEAAKFTARVEVKAIVGYDRKKPYAGIVVYPFRKNPVTGKVEKLVRFSIEMESSSSGNRSVVSGTRANATVSVLATGDTWRRIGVAKTGVVKLDYNFFMNTMGVDPSSIDPRNIRLYGNGHGMLPFQNSAAHYDDLKEYSIHVQGESDGVFDAGDYVLFYGVSPHRWKYNADTTVMRFEHQMHYYSDTTYYFVNWDLGTGKRISPQGSSAQTPTHTVTSFDDYLYHEEDLENMVKSGREWYGEKFEILSSYSFVFTFPNIVSGSPVSVETDMISRHSDSTFYQVTSGSAVGTLKTPMVDLANYTATYASSGNLVQNFTATASTISVSIIKQTAAAVGWLNFIEINARRQLQMVNGQQVLFRDISSVGAGNIAQYTLGNVPSTYTVWDVSDIENVMAQQGTLNGQMFTFTQNADTLKEFAAFDGNSFYQADYFGPVANQNLHGTGQTDYVIVSHPSFLADANELAQIHQVNDGLTTIVVTPQQVYNEFSSGAQDITAIRDFVRMLYDRASPGEEPKYLLLYGDGSYDNKRRLAGNTNFVPTFESSNSLSPVSSYISDDFYGLMDITEGTWESNDIAFLDIAIGRFPVQSNDQSKTMIDKIKKYTSKKPPSTGVTSTCTTDDCSVFGDWRSRVVFVADDEDGNQYMDQANRLATYIDTTYHQYNLDKIFLDAYLEEHTSGGDRYPDVNEAINQRVEKGCLIINYTGHGGEVGLAHERVLEVGQINSWKNLCNMPLFVTATCEFSRYDDPGRTSAGEYVLLNPDGGGIALFTTTRLCFAPNNYALNQKFNQNVFKKVNGAMPRLGDVYLATKNGVFSDPNARTFTMLGDPALRLAYPEHRVTTTHVNNVPVNMSQPDTMRALSRITVKGFVSDTSGNILSNYNGVIYPTVYDKYTNISTLNNDGSGVFNFSLQKNILFKGKVSVVNGDFSFSFVVPK
ncbi:MAG: hypothetical protein FD123_3829, partial [Bacteroidetes bacterium]